MLRRVRLLKVRQPEVLVADLHVARPVETSRRPEVKLRENTRQNVSVYSVVKVVGYLHQIDDVVKGVGFLHQIEDVVKGVGSLQQIASVFTWKIIAPGRKACTGYDCGS